MAYYTRVLSQRADCPTYDELVGTLAEHGPGFSLSVEEGDAELWTNLLLSQADGTAIAVIERNPVADGSLGIDEVMEFIDEITNCKPSSALPWLTSFLQSVKVIYAFQHLTGSWSDEGFDALHSVREFILRRGDAIIQADGEGFTNEAGHHILWQFSDNVSGSFQMAIRHNDGWQSFEMDLANRDHRQAFKEGNVPQGLSTF